MFNVKISFLTVLLLIVVYFSVSGVDYPYKELYDKEKYNDLTNCMVYMNPYFGECAEPVTCVKKAISKMILFGKHSPIYYHDVKKYYKKLHLYMIPDRIRTPEEFCVDKKQKPIPNCLAITKIFELDNKFDHLLPLGGEYDSMSSSSGAPPTEYSSPYYAAGSSGVPPTQYNNSYYSIGSSGAPPTEYHYPYYSGGFDLNYAYEDSSEELLTQYGSYLTGDIDLNSLPDNLNDLLRNAEDERLRKEQLKKKQWRILLNALYYHKTVDKNGEMDNDQLLTHHLRSSHGQKYLADINRSIQLKQFAGNDLLTTWSYCESLYTAQKLMCVPQTLTNLLYNRTFYNNK